MLQADLDHTLHPSPPGIRPPAQMIKIATLFSPAPFHDRDPREDQGQAHGVAEEERLTEEKMGGDQAGEGHQTASTAWRP